MIYLLLSAFSSLMIVTVFKLFGKYQIESFQAIVVNYIVCVTIGCTMEGIFPFAPAMVSEPWFPLMCFLGFFFVGGFYVASMTVQYFGLAISSVAQRMSLVISVSFAILFFNEAAPITKIIGIVMALSSVICINIPTKKKEKDTILDIPTTVTQPKIVWLLPFAIFMISGIIEVILQYAQKTYNLEPSMQCILLFGSASIIGSIALTIALAGKKIKLEGKNIIGGIAVGIPNYFSIYFLLLALQKIDGSIVYPVSNILIVGSAALLGYFVFKEKLSTINILGVILALLSIFLITV